MLGIYSQSLDNSILLDYRACLPIADSVRNGYSSTAVIGLFKSLSHLVFGKVSLVMGHPYPLRIGHGDLQGNEDETTLFAMSTDVQEPAELTTSLTNAIGHLFAGHVRTTNEWLCYSNKVEKVRN